MGRYLLTMLLLACFPSFLMAQGFAFGPKGGLTIGVQKYNSFQRDPLLKLHGALYIESLTEEDKSSLFAQLGYHVKGSAIRSNSFVNSNGQNIKGTTYETSFKNISLLLGAKQKFDLGTDRKWYYLMGLRAEYTVDTNLEVFITSEKTVREFTYGFTAGGGLQWMWSELVGGFLEVSVSPDLSNQIYIPPQRHPVYPNQIIPESNVKNLAIEVSVGLRLLRKVEYID